MAKERDNGKIQSLLKDIVAAICNPLALIVLVFAILCYGFTVTHFAVGVDDTAMKLYFYDGMAVNSGRWTIFFINRILRLNVISWPTWIIEILSVILLCLSGYIWVAVYRLCIGKVDKYSIYEYVAVSLYISNSILSELWVYYFHNGICLGYCFCALSVFFFLSALMKNGQGIRNRIKSVLICVAFLTISIGCYESMLEVFVVAVLLAFFVITLSERRDFYNGIFTGWLLTGVCVCGLAILARTCILSILKDIYDLSELEIGYNPLFGDVFDSRGNLTLLLKKLYLRYYVDAVIYLPITIYVICLLIIIGVGIYWIFRKNSGILFLIGVGIPIFQVLFSIVGGRAELYRMSQQIPLISLVTFGICCTNLIKTEKARYVMALFGSIICLLQSVDMNRWFYQDYLKYQESKQIMISVANDLLEGYDISKPLLVEGAQLPSEEIYGKGSVPFDSWQYAVISAMTDFIDPHLKEKYHVNYGDIGYAYEDSSLLSLLTWAHNPFSAGSNLKYQQYTNFWSMLGYDEFTYISDEEVYENALKYRESHDCSSFPDDGYIVEKENYILINLS